MIIYLVLLNTCLLSEIQFEEKITSVMSKHFLFNNFGRKASYTYL